MPEILSFQVFFQIFELLDIQFTKIQNFKYLISLPSKFNIQYNSISIESYLSSTSTQYRARFPLLFFSFPFLSLREEGGGGEEDLTGDLNKMKPSFTIKKLG